MPGNWEEIGAKSPSHREHQSTPNVGLSPNVHSMCTNVLYDDPAPGMRRSTQQPAGGGSDPAGASHEGTANHDHFQQYYEYASREGSGIYQDHMVARRPEGARRHPRARSRNARQRYHCHVRTCGEKTMVLGHDGQLWTMDTDASAGQAFSTAETRDAAEVRRLYHFFWPIAWAELCELAVKRGADERAEAAEGLDAGDVTPLEQPR